MESGGKKLPLAEKTSLVSRAIESKARILLVIFFTHASLLTFKNLYLFLDITFEHKVYPKAITLFEVYNPGSLVRIWAKDANCKWHLLYEADSLETPSSESRKFKPPLNDCNIVTK